ncbi:MAG: hypothetical protein ACREIV_11745, partial [Planctomycetaceae bacterium]
MIERSTDVSSLIDVSQRPAGTPALGESDSGIIHFDATLRRKEKMRHKAEGEKPASSENLLSGRLPFRPDKGSSETAGGNPAFRKTPGFAAASTNGNGAPKPRLAVGEA